MKNNFKILAFLAFGFFFTSCLNDLDQAPNDDRNTSELSFEQDAFGTYRGMIAKLYGSYALTGQEGPAGAPDIVSSDEGFTSYTRVYWQLQSLPTDEAIVAWNDPGIQTINFNQWTSQNAAIFMMYYRIYFNIALANEFIRQSSEELINSRSMTEGERDEVRGFREEARFIRAFSYYHAIDMFGNVGFVDESVVPGLSFPVQMSRAELFGWLETELLDLEDKLQAPRFSYGRADKGVLWMTLAKLYLNAQVYKGQAENVKAMEYINKVIQQGGYSLATDYHHNFLADNDTSPELIFPVSIDGARTRSFGATNYIINAAMGGTMTFDLMGVNGAWAGNRTRRELVQKFEDPTGNTDSRAFFWTDDQTLNIQNPLQFQQGYGVTKWRNITSAGMPGSNAADSFVDTDYVFYRLGDAYLMYAEAHLRGGGGSLAQATDYVNALRMRAYGNTSGNITQGQLNLDFIIDERARELYWEGHRRQDLIRFGHYTGGTYNWQWKGGSLNGSSIPSYLSIYPIPAEDVQANPNIVQNPGY
ncbi:MAG: RagB/SusD family nutrient uptake outer membrane protein [Weeksellaceae bacterium]|nr:RagB/SusD family nutrient uptake outer membrane protein [Weeksellaceae bacterium]